MARQRRGGSFRTPELRGTLGTLLRTTREVIERGAREGRTRLDEALASRRRNDALAHLGEVVLDLVRRGEIDVTELPEARDVIAHLDELDAGGRPEPEHPEQDDPQVATAPFRRRFDARSRDADGTVSSATWAPPNRSASATRVWRPPSTSPNGAEPALEQPAPRARPNPLKQGGISFDDDEDLSDYMHPDDVPPKPDKP